MKHKLSKIKSPWRRLVLRIVVEYFVAVERFNNARIHPRQIVVPATIAQAVIFLLFRNIFGIMISNLVLVGVAIAPAMRERPYPAHWVS